LQSRNRIGDHRRIASDLCLSKRGGPKQRHCTQTHSTERPFHAECIPRKFRAAILACTPLICQRIRNDRLWRVSEPSACAHSGR
jgi:hypothetical protein